MNGSMRGAVGVLLGLLVAGGLQAAGAVVPPGPERHDRGVVVHGQERVPAENSQAGHRTGIVRKPTAGESAHAMAAANPARDLSLGFGPRGVRPVPGTAIRHDPAWSLRLDAIGVPGDLRRPDAARPRVDGKRVELARGVVTEWYASDERGLEQGFTFPAPLPWAAGANELVVRLAVEGAMQARLADNNTAVLFARPGRDPVLRYGQLQAFDATGRQLPVRFGLVAGGVDITVATAGARYPLVVDPLATVAAWTASVAQEGASFGTSVASAGDVNGDGHADVIVGAPSYSNGQSGEGAVFVYYGSPTGLSATPDWKVESNQADAAFGTSVASAGDVNGDGIDDVIIGAPGYANGGANAGAVFVYYGSKPAGLSAKPSSGTEPSWHPDWQVLFSQAGANFGTSVATAGDVNNDGVDDVIVGAPDYTSDPVNQVNEGAAFVYYGPLAGVGTTASWTVESNQANAVFGTSVATAGDVDGNGYADVIVGSPGYTNGQEKKGAAFVYYGRSEDNGLSKTAKWTADSNQTDAGLGWSVASAGDVNADGYDDVIVGAPWYSNGQPNEGTAFVYHGSAGGLTTVNWTVESNQGGSFFGYSVSTAGDVDKDGYDEVIIGADFYDNAQEKEGAAFVYHGSASGLQTTIGWMGESDQEYGYYGRSVAAAGDVDKNGFADVVVGAPGFDRDENFDCGAAFLYRAAEGSFFLIPTPSGGATLIYLD